MLSLPATNENDGPGLTGLVFNGIPLVEDVEDDSPSNLTLHSCKEQWARLFRRNWQISACFGRASRYESAFEMSGVPVSLVLDFFGDAHEKGKPRRSGALKDGLVHPRFQWYFIPPRESPRLLKLIGGAEMLTREFLNGDGTLYQRVSVMKVVVKYSEALGHLHVTLRAERFNASGLQVGPSAQVCSWEFRSFAYQQRVFASLGWGDHGQKLPWEENINPSSQRNACPHCTFATSQNQWALLQIHINECHPKIGVG